MLYMPTVDISEVFVTHTLNGLVMASDVSLHTESGREKQQQMRRSRINLISVIDP